MNTAVKVVSALAAGGVALATGTYLRGASGMRPQADHHKEYWDGRDVVGDRLLVALGDSSSQGVGVQHPEQAWVHGLADELAERWQEPVGIANLSVSGATVGDLVTDQLPHLSTVLEERGEPDVLTVSIGVNDTIRPRFDLDRFSADFEKIMIAVPRGSFVGDLPSFGGRMFESRVRRANTVIPDLVRDHGHHLVPLYEASRRTPLWKYFTTVAGDWFHPNATGYRLWCDVWRTAVADVRFADA